MFSVYRTLSLRYLRQRWARALLIVASIALGVATLVATRTLNDTMDKAVRSAANPLAGGADLIVSEPQGFLDSSLAEPLRQLKGVRSVRRLLFAHVKVPSLKSGGQEQTVLLVGVDAMQALQDNPWGIKAVQWDIPKGSADWWKVSRLLLRLDVCMAGEELNRRLDEVKKDRTAPVRVRPTGRQKEPAELLRVGVVTAEGPAAALGGNILFTPVETADRILGEKKGLVSRLDLALTPGFDREKVRRRVEEVLARRHTKAEVKTPEEQVRASQRVMSGMQAGFALSGLGALVVGMFLVYNALSVSVAERRHEIGILRSLGATRGQVRRLFAGEAAVLGLAGAALGVPLGMALAYLALEPMKEVVSEIFRVLEANRVEWTLDTIVLAAGAGMVTAVLASLVPAFRASAEEPAVAVRRVPQSHTWRYRLVQLAASVLLMVLGAGLILVRDRLPERMGGYGGLVLVLLGALLATPLLAAVAARLVQPLGRALFGIEGRLAADNLVRTPARTGLVIAALAAGVALVLQTAGTVQSNRDSVRDWVDRYITADLFITAGSPVGVGDENQLMEKELGPEIPKLNPRAIKAVLPVRYRPLAYGGTQISLVTFNAREYYEADRGHRPEAPNLDLYRQMAEQPGTVIVSENFAALYGVRPGDTITVSKVQLRVLGKELDYSWNHGTVIMDAADYRRRFGQAEEPGVNAYDVYLHPGADPDKVQTQISRHFGADKGLVVLTHAQLQGRISDTIERLYAIAYGQQIVVGVVAALGVVTALLISVLQRRREMGVLRAIGASRGQVIYAVLAEAALMGLIGTAIGLVVGVPLEWYILQVIILEESGYLFPVVVPWAEAGLIAGAALVFATLAGLLPALHAVRQRIPEAIAHE